MSSKIDGVPRELLANFIEYSVSVAGHCSDWLREKEELRALLAAPVVERQPVAWEIRYKDGDDHQGFVQTEDQASYYRGMAYHVIPLFASRPGQVSVVMPEHLDFLAGEISLSYTEGWNACLDKVKELNG